MAKRRKRKEAEETSEEALVGEGGGGDSALPTSDASAQEAPDPVEISVAQTDGESFESILETVSREGLAPKAEREEVEEARDKLERAVRVPLEVYVRVERGDRVARALTQDISVSGLYLAALTLPIAGPGEQVMVEIALPGVSDTVWATAKVARSPSDSAFPALGLAFENLTDTDKRAIQEYIENRARFLDED